MILHLFPAEKFTTDYINRINNLFDSKNQLFIVFGMNKEEYCLNEIKNKENVIIVNKLYLMGKKFESLIMKSSKVICHSLFFKLIDICMLNKIIKKTHKKLIWVIWGKDLYEDYDKSHTIKGALQIKPLIKEFLRRSLIYKISIFITTGDVDILKKRYKLNNNAKFMSAQYSYKLLDILQEDKHDKINIMVGHSATETCRHIPTFEMLKKYSDKINVFCPLSYPKDEKYINKVKEAGYSIFKDSFFPITEFMKYDEYVKFLNKIDIGVFNNNRQQGMGNITNLLYFGKKVYLSSDNTIRKSYYKPKYYIYDCEDIKNEDFLCLLDKEKRDNNKNNIIYKFSDENFFNEWSLVFNE